MKLYILPYEFFENQMKNDFTIFKRTYHLYQFEDEMFLFYRWKTRLLSYPVNLSGFSTNIDNYNLDNISDPLESYAFKDAISLLKKYKSLDVKFIGPKNDFILGEIKYLLYKLNVKEFEYIIEEIYENKSEYFYRNYLGSIENTSIDGTIYYQKYLTILNHFLKVFFFRTTVEVDISVGTLLMMLEHQNSLESNRTLIVKLESFEEILAYKLEYGRLYKDENGKQFNLINWKDRYIEDIFDEGTVFQYNNDYYFILDKINLSEIIEIKKANYYLNEFYYDLDKVLPQSLIFQEIEKFQFPIDGLNTIQYIPKVDFFYPNFKNDLVEIKEIMKTIPKEQINTFIKDNIKIMIEKIKLKYKPKGKPLGICPSCETGLILNGKKGFFCSKCEDFMLWNKNIINNIGYIPSKSQMKFLLRSNTYTIYYRNRKLRLTQRKLANNAMFWKLLNY